MDKLTQHWHINTTPTYHTTETSTWHWCINTDTSTLTNPRHINMALMHQHRHINTTDTSTQCITHAHSHLSLQPSERASSQHNTWLRTFNSCNLLFWHTTQNRYMPQSHTPPSFLAMGLPKWRMLHDTTHVFLHKNLLAYLNLHKIGKYQNRKREHWQILHNFFF